MELKDLLKPNEIFGDENLYAGEWVINGIYPIDSDSEKIYDYLSLNSKMVNGKSAYKNFVFQNYQKPLGEILKSIELASTYIPRIIMKNTEKGKQARFCLSILLYQQSFLFPDWAKIHDSISELEYNGASDAELIEVFKKGMRASKNVYIDILKNGKESEHFEKICKIYEEYLKTSDKTIPFFVFLKAQISSMTSLSFSLKYYEKLFSKDLNIDELISCFDYDVFCLILARSALDACLISEEQTGLIGGCCSFLYNYFQKVEELLKEDKSYNPIMTVFDEKAKKKKVISLNKIKREYEDMIKRHPEISFYEMDGSFFKSLLKAKGYDDKRIEDFNIGRKEDRDIAVEIVEMLKKDRELTLEWDIIPKGTKRDFNQNDDHHKASNIIPADEKMRRRIISYEYLENSDYLYKIYGTNKFDGFVGYVYKTGKVVFETKIDYSVKFNKNELTSATYVMQLDKLLFLTRLTKSEIIDIIQQDQNAGVKRFYHSANMDRWMSNVERLISGSDYTPQIMQYIDNLITNDKLKNKEK